MLPLSIKVINYSTRPLFSEPEVNALVSLVDAYQNRLRNRGLNLLESAL